jgi:hypothetical protein
VGGFLAMRLQSCLSGMSGSVITNKVKVLLKYVLESRLHRNVKKNTLKIKKNTLLTYIEIKDDYNMNLQ